MQMSLFNRWIDGQKSEPTDGQEIMAYYWIENPDQEMPMFKKHHIEFDGITISGPTVTRYHKKYVADGTHRKIALWQPIDALPKPKKQGTP